MKLVLFSPMRGRVYLERKSVKNAIVTRCAKFRGKAYVQRTMSNSGGEFNFAPIIKFGLFDHRKVRVIQEVTIEYQRDIYLAWCTVKANSWCGGEISESRRPVAEPIRVECDLAEPAARNSFFNIQGRKKLVFGIARIQDC